MNQSGSRVRRVVGAVILPTLWTLVLLVFVRIAYNLGYGQGLWDCSLGVTCRGHNYGLPPAR